jgi:hypothetical protein
MKHRAGECRFGVRRDFGHGRYHANQDVFCKKLYYDGDVEIHHFQYSDASEHSEDVCISAFTSVKDAEANVIFQIDFERFLTSLSRIEHDVFLMRL